MSNFDFFGQNLPKNEFWGQNFKSHVRIRNRHFQETICANFQHLWLFGPKFDQKWILGSKFQKSKSGFGISILEILCVIIFRQNGQVWIFEPKFDHKWILGSKFQKSKSGFRISIIEFLRAPIFRQNGQLLIFRPKFAEIAQLRAIFWSKYCWGCCRELGGGWNELGGGWNELGGGGWRWVEVGARFSNIQYQHNDSIALFSTNNLKKI